MDDFWEAWTSKVMMLPCRRFPSTGPKMDRRNDGLAAWLVDRAARGGRPAFELAAAFAAWRRAAVLSRSARRARALALVGRWWRERRRAFWQRRRIFRRLLLLVLDTWWIEHQAIVFARDGR